MTCNYMTCHDCEQEGPVCATPPGCYRHWEERNRELVAERAELRAEVERLQSWTPIGTYSLDVQHEEERRRLTMERDEARAERNRLHLALRKVLDALGNGSAATEDASVTFLCGVPDEVRAEIEQLQEERRRLTMERDEALAILRKREPTQEEAEDGETAPGRTHVKSGDWTGRVCVGCAVWVWRGRTMCDACETKEQQT